MLPLIEKFGGRFLSRGGEAVVLESGRGWRPDRMVIIEFPTMDALKDWYHCADYAPVRDINPLPLSKIVADRIGGGGGLRMGSVYRR